MENMALWLLETFGPNALLLGYLWMIQQRLKNAVISLASNVQGVDSREIREDFRLISD